MHGNHFMNKEITVTYAFKKDGKGERHGDDAERRLAAEARQHGVEIPKQALAPVLTAVPQPQAATPAAPPYSNYPPPQQFNPAMGSYYAAAAPPTQAYAYAPPTLPQPFAPASQLPAAPAGLPARPPAANAGYGGPPAYGAPFAAPPFYAPPPQQPPVGFAAGAPPPGVPPFAPQGAPGFAPFAGPPGFAPPAQQRQR